MEFKVGCVGNENLKIEITMKNLVDEREVLLENIDPNDDKDDIEGYIKDFVNDSQNIMSKEDI